jgi:hypothetical protein
VTIIFLNQGPCSNQVHLFPTFSLTPLAVCIRINALTILAEPRLSVVVTTEGLAERLFMLDLGLSIVVGLIAQLTIATGT